MAAKPKAKPKARIGRPPGIITPERREVEKRWKRGESAAKIAKALGWQVANPNSTINVYRSRGWDLPSRRKTPTAVCPKCGATGFDPCISRGRPMRKRHVARTASSRKRKTSGATKGA